jgi:hypothetical protein
VKAMITITNAVRAPRLTERATMPMMYHLNQQDRHRN